MTPADDLESWESVREAFLTGRARISIRGTCKGCGETHLIAPDYDPDLGVPDGVPCLRVPQGHEMLVRTRREGRGGGGRMITPSDMAAVERAVRSFRQGAPITVDDVRFASAVDGHPLSHLTGREVGRCLTKCCTVSGKSGSGCPHNGSLWVVRT